MVEFVAGVERMKSEDRTETNGLPANLERAEVFRTGLPLSVEQVGAGGAFRFAKLAANRRLRDNTLF